MENINEQELREVVNPVFNTAKSCIQLNAEAGEEDSIRLLEALGFDSFGSHITSKRIPKIVVNQVLKLLPAYMILVEGRFQMTNNLIDSRKDMQVLDLPCGYTSRGIRLSKQGRRYIGLDLPAVIDELLPAVKSIIGDNPNVSYHATDATNLSSLEAAIPEGSSNILVTTEGLLMYFTQSELDEVFSNIHSLLSKYGGSWVITDRAYSLHDKEVAVAALNHNPILMAMYSAITGAAAGSAADVNFDDNVFFDSDDAKVREYVKSKGFDLNEVCMGDYLPEHLGALDGNPGADEAVREAFKKMFFWELSVSEGAKDTGSGQEVVKQSYHSGSKAFSVDALKENDLLKMTLSGRLDTLTSPDLLKSYQEASADGNINSIELDFENLEYVSSAGLRVLLIMYKGLKNKNNFKLTNVNDAVREILETTGFDSAFLK